jgi:IS605 OrfB family transposase
MINQFVLLNSKFKSNKNKLWNPINLNFNCVDSDSWFDIKESNPIVNNNVFNLDTNFVNNIEAIKGKRLELFPNDEQKNILLKWIDAYIDMQNEVIRFMKSRIFNNKELILKWNELRDIHLKHIRNNIVKKYNTNVHCMDKAIKEACGKFKSAMSNHKSVKKFRIRYIKNTKKIKTIKFEKGQISKNKNSFCSDSFGKIFKTNDSSETGYFKSVSSDFTIQYNTITDKFTLFYAEKVKKTKTNNKKQIAIDPGIRTFMTGYSGNHCIEIGNNLYQIVENHLDKMDGVNNNKRVKNRNKKKRQTLEFKHISNQINDLHWKSIKYLTDNYKEIVFGNMSTKQIVGNQLDSKVKRVGTYMRLYVFKQRLKYKCYLKGIKFTEIDERHTSKFCSNCGNYHQNLGSSKIYECQKCKNKIGRDINASKNIFFKALK